LWETLQTAVDDPVGDDAGQSGHGPEGSEMADTTEVPRCEVELWADDVLRDPFATYAELRKLGPVVWLEHPGVFALTRYDGVRAALQDWRTFTSAKGVMISDEMNSRAGNGVIMSDPPDHDRRRKVLNQQLVPKRMRDREEFVDARAAELVDRVLGRESVEVVHDLGTAFSVSVVGDLVGLPEEGRHDLVQYALDGFDMWGPTGERYERGRPGFECLLDYVAQVAVPERLTPGGWGTEIFDAAVTGDVEPDECPGIIQGYIHAGMDTTASAVASAVLLFGRHPDAWTAVRADRSLLASALDEVIRLHSPVQRYTRCTTVDTEVDGVSIPAGSRVLILIGSANRDERRFPDPDVFDIARPPTSHIAFGFGVHRCAGAALATTELMALFGHLADRVERFELGDHRWNDNAALHGLAELTATLHVAS
jgi:cytochrome P450